GGGAFKDGRPLQALAPRSDETIELLGIESSPHSIFNAAGIIERSEKVRVIGSMALSIAHTAAGTFDVFCSPIQARIFDMSASLLLAREAGAPATDLDGNDLSERAIGLDERTSLLVAATPVLHRLALELYRQPGRLPASLR
ncbi:MAG TPA: inositol monophosphatase family protein, partial [Solirubrobacterales bacterium]|nr:inositol monophosphatase family protein [Solirubrobacterales bacterium]